MLTRTVMSISRDAEVKMGILPKKIWPKFMTL